MAETRAHVPDEREALIARFNYMRNSGICSPTTRGLLDDAEALINRLTTEMHQRELHHFETEQTNEVLTHVVANRIARLLDEAVLTSGTSGVRVYDDREHYHRGRPKPLPIREWLKREAERIRNGELDDDL